MSPTLKRGFHLLFFRILVGTEVTGGWIISCPSSPTACDTSRKYLIMVSMGLLKVRLAHRNLLLNIVVDAVLQQISIAKQITQLEKGDPFHPKKGYTLGLTGLVNKLQVVYALLIPFNHWTILVQFKKNIKDN